MARSLNDIPRAGRNSLVVGVDWGGGGVSRTAIVVGYMQSNYTFRVCFFKHITAKEDSNQVVEEVANVCRRFSARWIGVDGGGNGSAYNRWLLDRLNRQDGMFAIFYSATDQKPHRDGALFRWTVGRSATIGNLFSRVKKRAIQFPKADECNALLDEFICEVVEYDEHNRTVKYTHPETQLDDALHATNYALQVAIYTSQQNQDARLLYA